MFTRLIAQSKKGLMIKMFYKKLFLRKKEDKFIKK